MYLHETYITSYYLKQTLIGSPSMTLSLYSKASKARIIPPICLLIVGDYAQPFILCLQSQRPQNNIVGQSQGSKQGGKSDRSHICKGVIPIISKFCCLIDRPVTFFWPVNGQGTLLLTYHRLLPVSVFVRMCPLPLILLVVVFFE